MQGTSFGLVPGRNRSRRHEHIQRYGSTAASIDTAKEVAPRASEGSSEAEEHGWIANSSRQDFTPTGRCEVDGVQDTAVVLT